MKADLLPQGLLSHENCVNSTRIRGFLTLSRIASDDAIKTHLNELKHGECDKYYQGVILPNWNARANAIAFCGDYAAQLRNEIQQDQEKSASPEFDLRLDPYALRNYKQSLHEKFVKVETIENWVQNEKSVESIVHQQSVVVLNQKCYYKDWYKEFQDLLKSQS